jgi:hypothetical protein
VISKVFHRFHQNFRARRHGIYGLASGAGCGQVPQAARDKSLCRTRLIARAQTVRQNVCHTTDYPSDDEEQKHVFEADSFHE